MFQVIRIVISKLWRLFWAIELRSKTKQTRGKCASHKRELRWFND